MSATDQRNTAEFQTYKTGVVVPGICGICASSCPVDLTIQNQKIVRVEASKIQGGSGYLCAKGAAGRGYVYREDRLKTPLRRVGARGGNAFEPITWDEAYAEIAAKTGAIKSAYGPDSVAFYTGYSKWYRPLLHRLAHSFGTLNYGTESSSCHQASVMANLVSAGVYCRPDVANAELLIAWGVNPFHSGNFSGEMMEIQKEKGLRVLCVDPRVTPYTQQYADIHLRPKPGTDGALAHFFAKYLIRAKKTDAEFIERYVHGYPQYAEYVEAFDIASVSRVTGISEKELRAAAQLIARHSRRFTIQVSQAAITHHINGFQSYRAIIALCAITGNVDREGGLIPMEYPGKDDRLNKPRLLTEEFIQQTRPDHAKPKIGSERFPLWSELIDEFQAMDLWRNILEGTPYPIKAVIAFGMNVHMFPGNAKLFEALSALDFYVDVDIFDTDSAKYADIILPACSPYERTELIGAMGGGIRYSQPAIPPLYESRSDADIISQLAAAFDLDDPLLRRGYDACSRSMLREIGLTMDDLKESPAARRIPGKLPYFTGHCLRNGFDTPTGKYELYSERIAKYQDRYPYDPLPVFVPPIEAEDEGDERFPLTLTVGGRLPHAFHSRFHNVRWARALRPDAAADIHPGDAGRMGIQQGDSIAIATANGEITAKANLTWMVPEGSVFMFQGYVEADANAILGAEHLDPYSGFPGYRSNKCAVRKINAVAPVKITKAAKPVKLAKAAGIAKEPRKELEVSVRK
ncbi:MAG: molybdopterin-dependent oxidoreductase [Peptococcaceae bacterium]|jgi:anaerobic selenocysteine-containing dehydrogenase|nr:molybdopterin-dependent oxidoreductase [Peptococcaceae bacterium]